MADEQSSFNSSGATEVAFETINSKGVPDIGVSANANRIGVYGEGRDGPNGRPTKPEGTGVVGRGDIHGVYGVSATISDADTPVFVSSEGGVGVVGVAVGCPAILGESGIVGNDAAQSVSLQHLVNRQLGVAGVSLGGPGVFGLNLSNDLVTDPIVPEAVVDRRDVDGTNVVDAGVEGLSLRGPGVHGVSRFERGGVFETTIGLVAQLRLIPIPLPRFVEPGDPQPPSGRGEAGDLLALNYIDGNQRLKASLWFCTEGVSTNSSAVWVRVV